MNVPQPTLRSLEQAIASFERKYPQGFSDPRLIDTELRYKREAHTRFVTHFGHGRAQTLLDSNDLQAISTALDDLYHATNIPSRFEIMAVHDGLKDGAAAARLLKAALGFVSAPDGHSFTDLVNAVSKLPEPAGGSRVLTWPNVTILPFLADPKRLMVLKPTITRKMANRISFDLLYSSPPTWHTYEALLRMSTGLLDRLAPLGAQDFIDIQSFMWVTRGLE